MDEIRRIDYQQAARPEHAIERVEQQPRRAGDVLDDAHTQHDVITRLEVRESIAHVVEVVQAYSRLSQHASGAIEGVLVDAVRVDRVDRKARAREHQGEVTEVRSVVEESTRDGAATSEAGAGVDHSRDTASQIAPPIEARQCRRAAGKRREIGASDGIGDRFERHRRARKIRGKIRLQAVWEIQTELFLNLGHSKLHTPSRTWREPAPIKTDATPDPSNNRDTQLYSDGLIE